MQIAGAFTNWKMVDMSYVNKEHIYTTYLEPGVRYQYKFIVDGTRACHTAYTHFYMHALRTHTLHYLRESFFLLHADANNGEVRHGALLKINGKHWRVESAV